MKEFKITEPHVCCKCGNTGHLYGNWGYQDPGQGHDPDIRGIYYCPRCGQAHFEIVTENSIIWREC